jgi:Xaa-Pro aminopeptidase
MASDNLLVFADSERDADMLYAVGMFVPDPFAYLRLAGRSFVVMSDLEIDRARREAHGCRILSYSQYANKLRRAGAKKIGLARIIKQILRERRVVKKLQVPHNFPLGLARQLGDLKIKLKPGKNGCFPERQFKAAEEVQKISASLVMAEVGLAEGIQALKQSKIGKRGRLLLRGLPLTSERLRAIIETTIIQAGGRANHTIVAGGRQGCDPHERGHGLLRANEPIIIDIFPRSQKTGYYGDITRTVVRGRASEAIRKLYHTVARGQEIAFEHVRNSAGGREVHEAVVDFFARQGYKTGRKDGFMQGFFHGTGHGVGLDIHETPRISPASEDILRTGHVVTIEPGLYFREIGGVRLEDMALVKAKGCRNLTKFEKVLEV